MGTFTIDPYKDLNEQQLRERLRAVSREYHRLQFTAACLLDHYLTCYEQNDGEKSAGDRDALGAEAERLLPHWRTYKDEWKPVT